MTATGVLAALPLGVLVTDSLGQGEDDSDRETLQQTAWLSDRYALTVLPAVPVTCAPMVAGFGLVSQAQSEQWARQKSLGLKTVAPIIEDATQRRAATRGVSA